MPSRHAIAIALATAVAGSLISTAVAVTPAHAAAKPGWTKNCTALNKTYPHGVGKKNAKDSRSSGRPVTNFKRSDSLYATAMQNNKGLDRDKDGIACEKA